MSEEYKEAEDSISETCKKRYKEAAAYNFGNKLLAKVEFVYNHGKPLGYFNSMP
jgi:hypothetical protein